MARRSIRLFELLIKLPWWVGLVAAAIAYTIFTFIVPAFVHDAPLLIGLKAAASILAWLFAVFSIAAALLSIVRSLHARRLLAAQKDIESIRALSWQQFEVLVGEYWRRRGFAVMETGGGGADGGVDLSLRRDGRRYIVQCKQWRVLSVGVGPVRELFGVMKAGDASGAYLVTSGGFTAEAVQFAQDKPLHLIDGRALVEMIEEVRRAGSANEESSTLADSVMPSTLTETSPVCPACGTFMVKRTARQGASAGQSFWGCGAFPKCRGTRAA